MKNLVQKSIRFPAKAVEIIDQEVRSTLGVNFNEYIKIYVINKAEEIQRKNYLTPELRTEIKSVKKQFVESKKPVLKTMDEVTTYLDNLLTTDE